MDDTLTLAVCNFIVPEISEIITNGEYPDVKLISFNASCNANSIAKESIEAIVKQNNLEHTDLVVLRSTCIGKSTEITTNTNYEIITMKQCFEPFLNSTTIFHYIAQGYYIATNGWLRQLEQHKRNWGFENRSHAVSFFSESMEKILFLNTMIPGDYLENLENLSEYMNLPYEILPVGLDNCKLFLDSIIYKWRNEKERKLLNKRLANVSHASSDMLVIFDQLEILVNLTEEDKIIEVAFNLINILFAPKNIKYDKYIYSSSETFWHNNSTSGIEKNEKNSFKFEIYHLRELYGVIEVIGVRFPKHIHQYKVMAKNISQMLAISIANARKYSQIIEQKNKIEHYSNVLKKSNLTKDKFFSIIAHDLKGPFNAMLGFSDLLLEDIKDNNFERIEHYAGIVNNNLNETFDLLVNLLEWARAQLNEIQFKPYQIDAGRILHETRDLLVTQADRKDVFIKLDLQKNLNIYADENMFRTIFRNLISNAVKFSNPNGIIRVWSEIRKDHVLIGVTDNGVGIENSKLDGLFGMDFQSSDGTSGEKGTGLGLILCKDFMDAHNGRIWVESVLGEGTTFFTYFPLE